MTTYLIAWNPARTSWDGFERDLAAVRAGGRASGRWNCGTRKNLPPGSEFFLIRLAVPPRGIIAHGVTTSRPRPVEPADPADTRRGRKALCVEVEFDQIAPEPLVTWDELNSAALKGFRWNISGSGVALPQTIAAELARLYSARLAGPLPVSERPVDPEAADDLAAEAISRRNDIGAAEKAILIRARRGLGAYRDNLERIEHKCRLTGLLDRRHLRATHIKPWRESSDAEKLDGFNGLLLSPHFRHLFDRGYITFSDAGELLVSRHLNPAVLKCWGIHAGKNVGAFEPQQARYLEFHRTRVFERHGGGRREEPPAGS